MLPTRPSRKKGVDMIHSLARQARVLGVGVAIAARM